MLELCRALYREDPSPEPILDEQITRTIETLRREPLRGRIVVLDLDGGLRGYAFLISFWSNEMGGEICYIDEIFVDASHRGAGRGTELIKMLAAKHEIWPGNAIALELEVSPKNARARALYESLNFKTVRNSHMRVRI